MSAPEQAGLPARKAALEAFVKQAGGAEAVEVLSTRALTGGAIQENWLVELAVRGGALDGRHELVLRTDAPSGVAVSLSRAQEFRLLQAAWEAGVTVPEPLLLCEDAGVLGKPFYLMRRVAGTAVGHGIVRGDGPACGRDALAERLGEELARIHAIPPGASLDFLERPEGNPGRHTVARYREHLDRLGAARPALEWGLRWCDVMAPSCAEIVLVHQDFRTGNYMVDDEGLTGILDWEFCAWGDPMSDLGWFCARCWRFGHDDCEAGGIAARAPFYRGYERVSGRRVDPATVAYWEVVAHLRWAVIALQQGERFLTGGEASLDLALTGRRIAELEHEILRETPPQSWRAA